MRALTLWQPWASLVAVGGKRWETRSWSTKYRGPLLIHAAMRKPPDITKPLVVEAMIQELGIADFNELPRGVVLAIVDLNAVFLLEDPPPVNLPPPLEREILLGDFSKGRYVWNLTNIRMLFTPVPAVGRQRLWRPSLDLVAKVCHQRMPCEP